MNALVAYESMFGNTRDIACAIAEGIGGHTRVIPVERLTDDAVTESELLVVGGPTHAHGMSRPQTRQAAGNQGTPIADAAVGVREQLSGLAHRHISAAAFDTRINKPKFLTGAASKGIARSLRARGYQLVAAPESFLVNDTKGPLLAREIDRARAWGEALRERVESRAKDTQTMGGSS